MLKGFGAFISQITDQSLEKQPNICNGKLVTLCICSEFSGFQSFILFIFCVCRVLPEERRRSSTEQQPQMTRSCRVH